MNLRQFSQRAVSLLRSRHPNVFPPLDANRFLKERNARLIIQMKESRSFYGQRLDTDTQFSVRGDTFRVHVNLPARETFSISVIDERGQCIVRTDEVISRAAQALSLNLEKASLTIELDAAASINTSPP